jgi:hypothetical protein
MIEAARIRAAAEVAARRAEVMAMLEGARMVSAAVAEAMSIVTNQPAAPSAGD